MKKILAIILAAVLVLSFAACKKNDTNNDTTAGDAQTSGQAADVSASDVPLLPKRLPPRSRPK